jgi:hypothetical protein
MLRPIDYKGKENALSWDEIKAVIDDYIASGVKEIYVSGGKEPWISGKFRDSDKTTVDLIRYIRSRSDSVIISMLSIGLPLRKSEVRKTAVECMNIIRISLDAASPKRYDYLKGLLPQSEIEKGKNTGTFDKVRDYIRQTLELRDSYEGRSRLRIGMSFLCYEENYEQLEGFLKLAQDWGVDFVDVKGMLADPKSDKIEGFMDYVCSVYDRVMMGEFEGLEVYFHEIFFRNIGRRFDFDKELVKKRENFPEECFLALSGIRTTFLAPCYNWTN